MCFRIELIDEAYGTSIHRECQAPENIMSTIALTLLNYYGGDTEKLCEEMIEFLKSLTPPK